MKPPEPPTQATLQPQNENAGFQSLPADLPVPVDDGACQHLPGLPVPSVILPSTANKLVDLSQIQAPMIVLYCYPMTGKPGNALPEGWDSIAGARGCTPETCSFRDRHSQMRELGAEILGVSTQNTAEQQEMVQRLHVPYEVLSDAELTLTRALNLPTFQISGQTYIKRLTLVLRRGHIQHVFYPIFPPDAHAAEVLTWLTANAAV
ncbi:MAG TPA: peroxiredoxin [Candidatus Angelobacter sp.]|nr:peroxiredoxin [Candidatus Angelobacter sp.]